MAKVDIEIRGLQDAIENKINERIGRISASLEKKRPEESTSFIDRALDARDDKYQRNQRESLEKCKKTIRNLSFSVDTFNQDNKEAIMLSDAIRALPLLDASGLANKRIIDAYRKDFNGVRRELTSKIDDMVNDVTRELSSNSINLNVTYGGGIEKNTALRAKYPQYVQESVTTTLGKLATLYREKIDNYSYIQTSSEHLTDTNSELKTVEEYERIVREGKIEVKPKKKMFFIKEDPAVVISRAKKAAVDKAHAANVISKLEALNVPSSFSNTTDEINKIKSEYSRVYAEAEKKLHDADFENMYTQVKEVHGEELEEEKKKQAIKDAESLGYALAKARAEGNEELEQQIVEQISMLMVPENDKLFYLSEGQERFKEEQRLNKDKEQAVRDVIEKSNSIEKESNIAAYNEAKRQLEQEGKLDPLYVQDGLDVKGSVNDNLIHERMKLIMAQNQAINKGEFVDYHSMTPEQVTIEYLKAVNKIPTSATLNDAMGNQDFYIILNSVKSGTDLTDEINAALERRREHEKRAYKLFKIDKSKYDALSASRRQQIVRYMSMMKELDDSKVVSMIDYRSMKYQIDNELKAMETQEENENRRMHM